MLSSTLRAAASTRTRPAAAALVAAVNPIVESTQIRCRSNRSRRGLYDGKDIRFGNNVSFSERKTRRKYKPNVFLKRVYSETLDEMVQFHITSSALRTIDKLGGLDNYLLTSRHVTEGEGLKVKKRILERMAEIEEEEGQAGATTSA